MSVVACRVYKDRIEISADSIIMRGDTQEKRKDAKIYQCNDITFGAAGVCKDSVIFNMYCKTRKPEDSTEEAILTFYHEFTNWKKDKTDGDSSIDSVFILIFKNKAFVIEDYYIKEIDDYCAIGAGMDYALSALYLGYNTIKACEVACELSTMCEAPINTFIVNKV